MSDATTAIAVALPNYDVGNELGRGGMGIVIEGRQKSLDRRVAIKELPSTMASTAEVRERFRSEAKLLASMDHGHIVPVYDYVEDDALCLIVMEHLPGGTVWGRFTQQGLSMDSSCAITLATCEALHYAHQRQVLHRDVKPENVMFSAEGTVKVTDFGIAEVLGGGEVLATADGDLLGTPAYIAPEQAEGRELGPPADVFATGVMLYELLSGRLPYSEEGGPLAIVFRHANEDHIPLETVAPPVPRPIVDVVARSLQRDPAARYQTAEEFGVALGEAAASVWGPDWLESTELSVRVSGPIAAAAHRATGAPLAPAPPTTSIAPPADGEADGRSTSAVGGPPVGGPPDAGAGDARSTSAVGGPPVDGGAGAGDARSTSAVGGPPVDGGAGAGDARSTSAVGGPPVGGPPDAGAGDARPTSAVGGPPDAGAGDARSTSAVGGPPVGGPPPEPPSDPRASGVVRPEVDTHAGRGGQKRLDPGELVSVSDVLRPPHPPFGQWAAAAILLLAAAALAFVGLGDHTTGGDELAPGALTIAGADATDDVITLDLSEPVGVVVDENLIGAPVAEVAFEMSVAGIAVPGGDTVALEPTDLGSVAELGLSTTQYLVGGPADATVELLDANGDTIVTRELGVEPDGGGIVSVGGIVAIVLLLVVFAYTASFLRPMRRRGRRRIGSLVGLAIMGIVTGVALSMFGWTVGGTVLSLATIVPACILAAGAFVVLGFATARAARRRRVKTVIKKQNLERFLAKAA